MFPCWEWRQPLRRAQGHDPLPGNAVPLRRALRAHERRRVRRLLFQPPRGPGLHHGVPGRCPLGLLLNSVLICPFYDFFFAESTEHSHLLRAIGPKILGKTGGQHLSDGSEQQNHPLKSVNC